MSAENEDVGNIESAGDSLTSKPITKRGFMRGLVGATGAATVGGAGLKYGTGTSRAAAPLVPIGAGLASAAVGAYVGDKVSGYFDSDEDYSGYTGSDALWSNIYSEAIELQQTQEQILSSLENTAEFADNAALPKGMAAVVESLNDERSETAANDEMTEAIDEYYAGVQDDILDAWQTAWQRFYHWGQSINEFAPADGDTDFRVDQMFVYWRDDEDNWSTAELGHDELFLRDGGDSWDEYVELADGTSREVFVTHMDGRFQAYPHADMEDEEPVKLAVLHNDYRDDGYDSDYNNVEQFFDVQRFIDVWQEVTSSRDRVYANLSTFIDDVYDNYEPGEVDLEEFVDPLTAHAELSAEEDELAYAGAAASMLGIPRHNQPMDIYLEESDVSVIGSIYATDSPEGGFDVESTYAPEDYDYPIFMRYEGVFEDPETGEVSEEVDFVQLEQPFSIESATDSEGNEIETVEMDDGPTYDPSDIEQLQEELNQIHEEQLRMQEEAQNDIAGGGLFDDPLGLSQTQARAAAAGVVGSVLALLGLSAAS